MECKSLVIALALAYRKTTVKKVNAKRDDGRMPADHGPVEPGDTGVAPRG